MHDLVPLPPSPALTSEARAPALIAASGEKAERRFWEFFRRALCGPVNHRASVSEY